MMQAAKIHCMSDKSLTEALRLSITYANILGLPTILRYRGKDIPLVPGDIVDVVLENTLMDHGPSMNEVLL
jgi:hypothetical protein